MSQAKDVLGKAACKLAGESVKSLQSQRVQSV